MRRFFLVVTALITGAVAATTIVTAASAANKFFDPTTKRWVEYGSRLSHSGKSPIKREVVSYDGNYAPGTIVIDTAERRLYHVLENGKARKYGIGVGRDGFQWSGTHRVSRKAEWPGWTPPPAMRARAARNGQTLPAHMEGGPNNPLGARAMYIGSTIYRIHGSNEPWTIGGAVSSGCIRMANEDVMHLYENVEVGAKVVVQR
ncbi:L,D-transpeptidase [Breoghania sp. L-A4]|uniref:L,D-transpeptidase n=1 Tax=Breoghania sp. L-A4 TaxID=2304600 RepID=UPI000E35B116|nr:L,D-transpeptidase [Breoghania sp. L-A4]AXS40162.1 L,D-transpeptidase [Breoghania sp. L-A4]